MKFIQGNTIHQQKIIWCASQGKAKRTKQIHSVTIIWGRACNKVKVNAYLQTGFLGSDECRCRSCNAGYSFVANHECHSNFVTIFEQPTSKVSFRWVLTAICTGFFCSKAARLALMTQKLTKLLFQILNSQSIRTGNYCKNMPVRITVSQLDVTQTLGPLSSREVHLQKEREESLGSPLFRATGDTLNMRNHSVSACLRDLPSGDIMFPKQKSVCSEGSIFSADPSCFSTNAQNWESIGSLLPEKHLSCWSSENETELRLSCPYAKHPVHLQWDAENLQTAQRNCISVVASSVLDGASFSEWNHARDAFVWMFGPFFSCTQTTLRDCSFSWKEVSQYFPGHLEKPFPPTMNPVCPKGGQRDGEPILPNAFLFCKQRENRNYYSDTCRGYRIVRAVISFRLQWTVFLYFLTYPLQQKFDLLRTTKHRMCRDEKSSLQVTTPCGQPAPEKLEVPLCHAVNTFLVSKVHSLMPSILKKNLKWTEISHPESEEMCFNFIEWNETLLACRAAWISSNHACEAQKSWKQASKTTEITYLLYKRKNINISCEVSFFLPDIYMCKENWKASPKTCGLQPRKWALSQIKEFLWQKLSAHFTHANCCFLAFKAFKALLSAEQNFWVQSKIAPKLLSTKQNCPRIA